ncbi:hypothetical protein [Acinetobacter bereziniae]|uniref:hypothetical protein n=1 Tax=Acinetobacter bereziniae TaxID=106648 RepID=UPI003AF445F8
MIKSLLLTICFLTSMTALAYEEPLSRNSCFKVLNNKPQSIQKCHTSTIGGAGGIQRTFTINQDEYVLEWFNGGLPSEVYRISKNNGKALNASNYYRSNKSLKIINTPKEVDWECIKDSKNITHFCYK